MADRKRAFIGRNAQLFVNSESCRMCPLLVSKFRAPTVGHFVPEGLVSKQDINATDGSSTDSAMCQRYDSAMAVPVLATPQPKIYDKKSKFEPYSRFCTGGVIGTPATSGGVFHQRHGTQNQVHGAALSPFSAVF